MKQVLKMFMQSSWFKKFNNISDKTMWSPTLCYRGIKLILDSLPLIVCRIGEIHDYNWQISIVMAQNLYLRIFSEADIFKIISETVYQFSYILKYTALTTCSFFKKK